MDDIDVDKILVSNKGKYGTYKSIKYCAGYTENDEIRPLCIILSQMIGYVKCFKNNNDDNNNKSLSFKVTDKKLLKKYKKIWKEIAV